jgi:hypothetical protein
MKKPVGARTVPEYLAQIEQPRRADVEALDALIRKAVPKLEPAIVSGMIGYGSYHYKYASGRQGDCAVIGLASQKSYISVYVMGVVDGKYVAERSRPLFPKASIGKCCIRFKRLADIDRKALARVVKEGARAISAAQLA